MERTRRDFYVHVVVQIEKKHISEFLITLFPFQPLLQHYMHEVTLVANFRSTRTESVQEPRKKRARTKAHSQRRLRHRIQQNGGGKRLGSRYTSAEQIAQTARSLGCALGCAAHLGDTRATVERAKLTSRIICGHKLNGVNFMHDLPRWPVYVSCVLQTITPHY